MPHPMRRLAALAVGALLLPLGASAATGSWAQAQIATAVASGLMSGGPVGFRANDPLLPADLAQIVAGLAGSTPASTGTAPVTLAGLDAAIVRAGGLGDAAHRFYLGARRAGLAP